MLRILKNSAALSLSVLLDRGVSFILPWYIARVQGPEIWGRYTTALTFITIASMFAYWGLDQLLPREIARKRSEAGAYLLNASIIGGLIAVLTTVVVGVLVYFLYYSSDVQELIWLGLALILFPRTESILCEAVINGLERMEWIPLVRFPISLLRVLSSLLLLSRGFGLETLFIVLSVYHLLIWLLYLYLLRRHLSQFQLRFDKLLLKALFVQALPFVITISIGQTFKQFDRVLLSKLLDTDSVGIYSTGILLVQIVYLVAPAIMNALFPTLSRAHLISTKKFSSIITGTFKILLLAIFPVALSIIASAEILIPLVFGPEYTLSIAVLQIYAIGIVPSFVARLLYRTLLASNHERIAIRVALVNSAVNLLLNLLLIPRYGVLGAAVSSVLTESLGLAQNLLNVSRMGRLLKMDRALWRPGICILLSVLLYIMVVGRASSIVAWVISLLLYIATVLLSRVFTRRDLDVLTSALASASS